ncbi:MAG: hypothetical protein ACI8RZ_002376 [Myxococcota bacterium]|jgi:hypothetical protein
MRLLPLLLIGCGDKDPADTAPSTATVDSGDSAVPAVDPVITGTVTLPEDTVMPAEVTVGVVHLRFNWGPSVEGTLVSTVADKDGSFTLELPNKPLSISIYGLEDKLKIDGATHFLIAFEDTNKDGAFDEGEPLLGSPFETMVVYLESSPTMPKGWTEGWSLVDSGMSGPYETGNCLLDTDSPLTWRDYAGYPVFSLITDPVEIPLFGLTASLTLSGTAVGVDHLGVFAYQELNGEADIAPFADVASSKAFSVTLTDAPPQEAWITADPDSNYALGIPIAYTDADKSGDYTEGDERSNLTTCLDGEDAIARYTKPVTTWRGWRLMECYEANAGWRLVTQASDTGWKLFRTSQEATTLHIEDGACRW